MRHPIIRHDPDGTDTEGTAEMLFTEGQLHLWDFRDLDGNPLDLPIGWSLRYRWPFDSDLAVPPKEKP